MKKIIFILLGIFFFMDFSFLPIVNKTYLGGAPLLTTFLILLLVERSLPENIFWIIVTAFFINIISPFYFTVYLTLWLMVFGVVYFTKLFFIDENLNIWKRNIIFLLAFFFYRILLNLIYGFALGGVGLQNIFNFGNLSWSVIFGRLLIVVVIYNIVYKIFSRLMSSNYQNKSNPYKH